MLEDFRNDHVNPLVKTESLEVKPSAELIKKTMEFFEVGEQEAVDYLMAERRKIKERHDTFEHKQAA